MNKLITKEEKKHIKIIAKVIAKRIAEIDSMFKIYREIVGYEHTDISFLEDDDIVWTDDPKEMAHSMIDSCKSIRDTWNKMEMLHKQTKIS